MTIYSIMLNVTDKVTIKVTPHEVKETFLVYKRPGRIVRKDSIMQVRTISNNAPGYISYHTWIERAEDQADAIAMLARKAENTILDNYHSACKNLEAMKEYTDKNPLK